MQCSSEPPTLSSKESCGVVKKALSPWKGAPIFLSPTLNWKSSSLTSPPAPPSSISHQTLRLPNSETDTLHSDIPPLLKATQTSTQLDSKNYKQVHTLLADKICTTAHQHWRKCVCALWPVGFPKRHTWSWGGTGCGSSRRKRAVPSAEPQNDSSSVCIAVKSWQSDLRI